MHRRRAARCPSDIAIVGYDDIDFAAAAAVPLSSVRQPRQELGSPGRRLVLDEAADPGHLHQQVVFQPELVARASTLRLTADRDAGHATSETRVRAVGGPA